MNSLVRDGIRIGISLGRGLHRSIFFLRREHAANRELFSCRYGSWRRRSRNRVVPMKGFGRVRVLHSGIEEWSSGFGVGEGLSVAPVTVMGSRSLEFNPLA